MVFQSSGYIVLIGQLGHVIGCLNIVVVRFDLSVVSNLSIEIVRFLCSVNLFLPVLLELFILGGLGAKW